MLLEAALFMLAVNAPIAIVFDETSGLEPSERQALSDGVISALERDAGHRVVTEDFATSIPEIRARTSAQTVLIVSMIAGARLVRLTLERKDPEATRRIQLELPRPRAAWLPAVRGAVLAAFPLPKVEPGVQEPNQARNARALQGLETSAPANTRLGLSLGLMGAGVGIAGGATALRVFAERLGGDAAETVSVDTVEATAQAHRGRRFGTASNVLFGVAAATLTGALVYLLSGS